MEIKKIEWTGGGYDLHMIAGRVIELLTIHFVDGTSKLVSKLVDADNVTVTFKPTLKHKPNEDVRDFGIFFDMKKGILTINDPLPNEPGKRVYNFIIEVTVEDGVQVVNSAVRIHVHDFIVDAWLTPSKLSIRHGSDGFRFSILATFIDIVDGTLFQTPGDISRYPDFSDFHWKTGDGDETKVKFDSNGSLSALVSSANDIEIRAFLPPSYFGDTIPEARVAKVDVLPSWESLSTQVRLVGRKQISEEEIKKYPNLLFIAEGYVDKTQFEDDVNRIVEAINTPVLMPFSKLSRANRLNYWSYFIPSNNSIATPLYPIIPYFTTEEPISDKYEVTSEGFAVKPDPGDLDNEWTLQELIYVVGMPLLSDFFVTHSDDYDKKTEEWEKIFDTPTLHILRTKKAPIGLWDQWRRLALYQLANERDTALGAVTGSRPNVVLDPGWGYGSLSLHPFRTTRDQFDKLLTNLKTSSEFPIGQRWTSVSGHDQHHVVILCNSSPASGTTSFGERLIFVGHWRLSTFLAEFNGSQIDTGTGFSMSSSLESASTLCHEFTHVLGLQNESGGLDSMPSSLEAVIKDSCNVQAHSDVIDSSGGLTGISGKNIKWNWPRIMKAGVLKEYLSVTSTRLEIRLDNEYRPYDMRDYFNTANNVRFRQRTLPVVETSKQEFHIDSKKDDPKGDILTLKPTNSEEFNESDFPIGSLVIVTRPETLPVDEFPDDKPYQRLIHKAVLNHINVFKRPLTAPPPPSSGNIEHKCLAELKKESPRPSATETQIPRNIPVLRNPKPKSSNECMIIGLYEGGMDYYCSVYHASGYCNMRGGNMNRFCHVCRYFIVDKLDPSLHRDIDRIFENSYPNR